jgi:hypothetical protein
MLPNLLSRLERDTHKETVAKSLDALTDCMKFFGPGAVAAEMKTLVQHCGTLLLEKAPCQMAEEDDMGEEEKEVEREYDEVVIDSVTDTIGMVCAAVVCLHLN